MQDTTDPNIDPQGGTPVDDWFASNAPQAATAGANLDGIDWAALMDPNVDLTSLAAQYGMTRDQLADLRDQQAQPLIAQLRARAAGMGQRIDMSDAALSAALSRSGGNLDQAYASLAQGSGGDSLDGGVPTFGEGYSTLERPSYLQGPYTPPTWNETFTPLSFDQVMNEPGFQTGLNAGVQARERSAAARGTILNGGTQKALSKFGIDYGNNYYTQANNRAFDTYKQRYGQFMDAANLGSQARGINEASFQTDVENNRNQYLTRYQNYLDTIQNTRNAKNDYWGRLQDVTQNGLQAAALARPTAAGA